MAECAHHAGVVQDRFSVFVLVAVEEELWFRVGEIGIERGEAHVDLVVAVVDQARGVVGDEDVNRREGIEHLRDFVVLKKEVALGFVFPRAAKASEFDPTEEEGGQVEVANRRAERPAGVVVAFDCKYLATAALASHGQNGFVSQIAAGDQQVDGALRYLPIDAFVIRDDEEVHRCCMVRGSNRGGES